VDEKAASGFLQALLKLYLWEFEQWHGVVLGNRDVIGMAF